MLWLWGDGGVTVSVFTATMSLLILTHSCHVWPFFRARNDGNERATVSAHAHMDTEKESLKDELWNLRNNGVVARASRLVCPEWEQ